MAEDYIEWSGTFVRTRAEMFATALLMAVVAHWDIKLSRIPILGLEIADGAVTPGRGLVLLTLFAFFVYAATAFCIRAKVETNRMMNPGARVEETISSIEVLQEQLQSIDLNQFLPALESYAQNMKEAAAAALDDGLDKRLGTVDDAANKLMRAAQMADQSPKPSRNATQEHFRASRFEAQRDALIEAGSSLARSVEAMKSERTRLVELSRNAAAEFNAIVGRIEEAKAAQTHIVASSVASATIELGRLRRQLEGVGGFEMVERNAISFWAPLLASLGLTVLAILWSWPLILPWTWPAGP